MSDTRTGPTLEASWRDRAVERSLRTAREKAVSRSDLFIATAVAILSETGRTDFTVQELVERARTSLRSFYQHFSSKDELLLALCEEIIAFAATTWRGEIAELDSVSALRVLVDNIHGHAVPENAVGITQAVSSYHLQLAGVRPAEHARILLPLRDVILEVVQRGVGEGVVRTDIDAESLATMVMQTLVGAAHMRALRAQLTSTPLESERLWQFCVGALTQR
ncbi:TetR/AcrR family transcriptional regulator [Jatrophihabitans sp.]|uniref:TetR/AcrR family transcriptional regulator n=1 Tax=Jatrophihabitans sp. TaxID=1932789 RepID=UPI0030C6D70A|nr:TetR family transcriptional regulator [Jatrophihabitans sp.]